MTAVISIEIITFVLLLFIIILTAMIAIHKKDLLHSVILLGIVNTSLAAVFFILKAPDIAITQIAITAALETFIFIIAVHKTERREES